MMRARPALSALADRDSSTRDRRTVPVPASLPPRRLFYSSERWRQRRPAVLWRQDEAASAAVARLRLLDASPLCTALQDKVRTTWYVLEQSRAAFGNDIPCVNARICAAVDFWIRDLAGNLHQVVLRPAWPIPGWLA